MIHEQKLPLPLPLSSPLTTHHSLLTNLIFLQVLPELAGDHSDEQNDQRIKCEVLQKGTGAYLPFGEV
jgi:hypothetical protein